MVVNTSPFVSYLLMASLRLYSSVDNTLRSTLHTISTVYKTIRDAFGPQVYLMFEQNGAPYLQSNTNVGVSSSALPFWYYDLQGKCFVEWELGTSIRQMFNKCGGMSLPILSMEIVSGDDVVYDLTDFIGNIKVHTQELGTYPSVAHILAAWYLESGIVLDTTRPFMVRMLDINADTSMSLLNNHTFITEDRTSDAGSPVVADEDVAPGTGAMAEEALPEDAVPEEAEVVEEAVTT